MASPDQKDRLSSFIPTQQGFRADPRVFHPMSEDRRPSLKRALELWANTGNPDGLIGRTIAFQSEQVPSLSTIVMYEFLRHRNDRPYLFLTHTPMKTKQEKAILFEHDKDMIASFLQTDEPPRCVTTVTLHIPLPNQYPLKAAVTTIEGQVDGHIESFIAQDLQVSKKAVKRRIINPPEMYPSVALGLEEGIIGPFIPGPLRGSLHGFYYAESDHAPTTPVEIAITQTDSLFVQKETFEQLLEEYEGAILGPSYFRRIPAKPAA